MDLSEDTFSLGRCLLGSNELVPGEVEQALRVIHPIPPTQGIALHEGIPSFWSSATLEVSHYCKFRPFLYYTYELRLAAATQYVLRHIVTKL